MDSHALNRVSPSIPSGSLQDSESFAPMPESGRQSSGLKSFGLRSVRSAVPDTSGKTQESRKRPRSDSCDDALLPGKQAKTEFSTFNVNSASVRPENNVSAITGHPDIGTECPVCLDPLDLSERQIKLTSCKHLIHKDCLEHAAAAQGEDKLTCSTCLQRTAFNAPFWNEATGSFVYALSKSDLNNPRPFVGPPVVFNDPEGDDAIYSTLAFKGAPSIVARVDDTRTPPAPETSDMTVVADKGIWVVSFDEPGGIIESKHKYAGIGMMLIKMVSDLHSFSNWIKGKIGRALPLPALEINPNNEPRVTFDHSSPEHGLETTVSPGISIRSITKTANVIKFLGHCVTLGRASRWAFNEPQYWEQLGDNVTVVNLKKNQMNIAPATLKDLPDSSPETAGDEFSTAEGVMDADECFLNSQSFPWYERTRFSMRCSTKPGGEDPFAEIQLSFREHKESGVVLDSYRPDSGLESSEFAEFEENFFRGLEPLGDDEAFYIHVGMDAD